MSINEKNSLVTIDYPKTIQKPNTEIVSSGIIDICSQIDDDLITGVKKEYSIVGDGLYASINTDEAPEWLLSIIDNVVKNAIENNLTDYDLLVQDVRNAIDSIDVAANTYVEQINIDSIVNGIITTRLTTLNATYESTFATIVGLQSAIATSESATTLLITDLVASVSDDVNSRITNVELAYADADSTLASSIESLSSAFVDQGVTLSGTADAVSGLQTYVGLGPNSNPDGTGLLSRVNILENQADGVIEYVSGTYDVMLGIEEPNVDTSNDELDVTAEPYASWIAIDTVNGDETVRRDHIGDVYIRYDADTGDYIRAYKFIKTAQDVTPPFSTDPEGYTWSLITDTDAANALIIAIQARDLADGKRRVFVGLGNTTTPPTPYDVGDLWLIDAERIINGQEAKIGDIFRTIESKGSGATYEQNDWVLASSFVNAINSVQTELNTFIDGDYSVFVTDITNQVDQKAESFYQESMPRAEGTDISLAVYVGDLWKIPSNNKEYIYQLVDGTYQWVETDVPDSVFDAIDGKKTIYTGNSLPVGTDVNPIQLNDMWITGENPVTGYEAKTIYVVTSLDPVVWSIPVKYTDDENLNDFIDNTYSPESAQIKRQLDGKIEYYFYETFNDPVIITGIPSIAGATSEANALDIIDNAWNTQELRDDANGNIVYFKDSKNAYWYQGSNNVWLTVSDTSLYQALKEASEARGAADGKVSQFYAWKGVNAPASYIRNPSDPVEDQVTVDADGFLYWFKTDNILYYKPSSSWIPVPIGSGNGNTYIAEGDILSAFDPITGDLTFYTFNGSSWFTTGPEGIVSSSKFFVDLANDVRSETGLVATALTALTIENEAYTDGKVATLSSSFAFNNTLIINGVYYNSGFGLDTVGAGSLDQPPGADGTSSSTAFDSEFWINAERLVLKSPTYPNISAIFKVNAGGIVLGIENTEATRNEPKGDYNSGTTYVKGDIVTYLGSSYIALRETINDTPDISSSDWQLLAERGVDSSGEGTVELIPSSSTIVYNTAGNKETANIVLTAIPRGADGTLTYEFFVNNVSQGSPSSTTTFTYTPSNTYSSTVVTVVVELLKNGTVIASDQVTLTPIKSGSDTIVAIMSNESHTVPANSSGTVSSYANSGTFIEVYQGATKLTYETGTGNPTLNSRFRIIPTVSSIVAGAVSGSGTTRATFANASGMSADTAAITYTINVRNDVGQLLNLVKVQSFTKAKAGVSVTGSPGLNNATVYLYKRSATSNPTLPTTTSTYDFNAKTLTGFNNGWSTTIPTGTDSVYVIGATASSTSTTDTIASNEWSEAVILSSNGTNGLNSATISLFRRATSTPPVPSTNVTYTFSTGGTTGVNNSWSRSVPTGTDPVYTTTGTAISTGNTDVITPSEWATPQILAQNGANGDSGITATIEASLGTQWKRDYLGNYTPTSGSNVPTVLPMTAKFFKNGVEVARGTRNAVLNTTENKITFTNGTLGTGVTQSQSDYAATRTFTFTYENVTVGKDFSIIIDGENGTSVTVVSTTIDPDGNTVVGFSDGSSTTISKGSDGEARGVKPIYATDSSGSNASFTQGTRTFVNFYEWTGSPPVSIPSGLTYVDLSGTDGTSNGILAIYADDANGSNASLVQGTRKYINFYEWTGTKPTSVPSGTFVYLKIEGVDGQDSGAITSTQNQKWSFNGSLEGWSLRPGLVVDELKTASVVLEASSNDTGIQIINLGIPSGSQPIDGSKYYVVRARIRTLSTSHNSTAEFYYSTSSRAGFSSSYVKSIPVSYTQNDYKYLIFDMRELNNPANNDDWVTSTITGIRLDFVNSGAIGKLYEIDEISIGYFGSPSDGVDGDRGAGRYTLARSSTWTSTQFPSLANSVVPNGIPVTGDIVDIFLISDPTVEETRKYDGSNWQPYVLVLNGNLLVNGSVDGEAFKAESRLESPRIDLIGSSHMLITMSQSFSSDNLIQWYGPIAGNISNGLPILNNLTKQSGISWLAANGERSRDVERNAVQITATYSGSKNTWITLGTLAHESIAGIAEIEYFVNPIEGIVLFGSGNGTGTFSLRLLDNNNQQLAIVSKTVTINQQGTELEGIITIPNEIMKITALDNNSGDPKYTNKNYRLQTQFATGLSYTSFSINVGSSSLFKSLEVAQ